MDTEDEDEYDERDDGREGEEEDYRSDDEPPQRGLYELQHYVPRIADAQCLTCKKRYSDPHRLRLHLTRHTDHLESAPYCTLCNAQCTNAKTFNSHFNGKNHTAAVQRLGWRYCALCDVCPTSEKDAENHYRGSRHQTRVREVEGSQEYVCRSLVCSLPRDSALLTAERFGAAQTDEVYDQPDRHEASRVDPLAQMMERPELLERARKLRDELWAREDEAREAERHRKTMESATATATAFVAPAPVASAAPALSAPAPTHNDLQRYGCQACGYAVAQSDFDAHIAYHFERKNPKSLPTLKQWQTMGQRAFRPLQIAPASARPAKLGNLGFRPKGALPIPVPTAFTQPASATAASAAAVASTSASSAASAASASASSSKPRSKLLAAAKPMVPRMPESASSSSAPSPAALTIPAVSSAPPSSIVSAVATAASLSGTRYWCKLCNFALKPSEFGGHINFHHQQRVRPFSIFLLLSFFLRDPQISCFRSPQPSSDWDGLYERAFPTLDPAPATARHGRVVALESKTVSPAPAAALAPTGGAAPSVVTAQTRHTASSFTCPRCNKQMTESSALAHVEQHLQELVGVLALSSLSLLNLRPLS